MTPFSQVQEHPLLRFSSSSIYNANSLLPSKKTTEQSIRLCSRSAATQHYGWYTASLFSTQPGSSLDATKNRERENSWSSIRPVARFVRSAKFAPALTALSIAVLGGGAVFCQPLAAGAVTADSISTSILSTSSSWYTSLVETGFYQAFSLVFLSELGDKTFFIAGLLAMKTSRIISLIGSLAALVVMTVLSVVIGQIFHVMPSFGIAEGIPLDDIAAALAFAFFGIKLLKEAFEMEEGVSAMDEEFAEAEEAVKENEKVSNQNKIGQIISIFTLVFAAEFGDRSFLSTIALSAAQNPISVAGGAIAAHAVATGIAVAGGSVVAKYLSERVVGFIGGTLFLIFAATTALGIF